MKKDSSRKLRKSRSKKKQQQHAALSPPVSLVPSPPIKSATPNSPEPPPVPSEPLESETSSPPAEHSVPVAQAMSSYVAQHWPTILCFVVPPLLAIIAYRNASNVEFIGDTRFLIAGNAYIKSLSYWFQTLIHDYFWSSSGQSIPYWRPFTKLSWLIEWQWFRDWAGGYAWVSAAWHIAGCVGIVKLCRAIGLINIIAGIVAILYALHPVAIEPVGLIMDRSDVVAANASIWVVVTWLAWRRAEPRSHRTRLLFIAHVLLVIIAMASKEVSIVLPAILAAWAIFEGDLAAPHRKRLVTIIPSAVMAFVYFIARHAVLERYAAGLSATELSLDPLRFVTSLAWYLRNAWPLSITINIRQIPIAEAKSASVLLTNIVILAITALVCVWALYRRHVALGAMIAWAILGLTPVLLTRDIAVPTGDDRYLLASRWLYFSLPPLLIAYALLATEGLRYLRKHIHSHAAARAATAIVIIIIVSWATILVARSSTDRAWIASEMAMIEAEERMFYQSIPPQFRTRWDECRHEERLMIMALWRHQPKDVVKRGPTALARCPENTEVKFFYLDALVQLKRYEEAEGIARDLLRSPPRDARNDGRIAFLAGVTLLERGDIAGAKPLFVKAVNLGHAKCSIFTELAKVAAQKGFFIEAASALETAFLCGGRKDASLLFGEAVLLNYAGERDTARKVLSILESMPLSADMAAQVRALQQALK